MSFVVMLERISLTSERWSSLSYGLLDSLRNLCFETRRTLIVTFRLGGSSFSLIIISSIQRNGLKGSPLTTRRVFNTRISAHFCVLVNYFHLKTAQKHGTINSHICSGGHTRSPGLKLLQRKDLSLPILFKLCATESIFPCKPQLLVNFPISFYQFNQWTEGVKKPTRSSLYCFRNKAPFQIIMVN